MAFQSKSEQRLAGSLNYKGSESTLNSDNVKGAKDMGANGPKLLYGAMGGKKGSTLPDLYGKSETRKMTSGIAGKMSGDGFPDGPKWKRAMEPGELEPGKRSQASNTTRMTPGKGDKSTTMKTTGTTPKVLRGGGRGPR